MSWSSALTRVLTNFHISACSAHIVIIFYIYGDAFVSSIVLCTFYIIVLPFWGGCLAVCGIVDAGAYNFVVSFLPPTTTSHNNILVKPQTRRFSILGNYVVILPLSLLSGTVFFAFFCGLIKLAILCQILPGE